MQALPSPYNGYVFRSRSEARWALFWDAHGIAYRYESEGYQLDGYNYLPDFVLPEASLWIEVKGAHPTRAEMHLAARLALASAQPALVLWDDVWLKGGGYLLWPDITLQRASGGEVTYQHVRYAITRQRWIWAECLRCGGLALAYHRAAYCIECRQTTIAVHATPRLLTAYTLARSARFDRGAPPRPAPLPRRTAGRGLHIRP